MPSDNMYNRHAILATCQYQLVVAMFPELLFHLPFYSRPHPHGALRDSLVGLAPCKVCIAKGRTQ